MLFSICGELETSAKMALDFFQRLPLRLRQLPSTRYSCKNYFYLGSLDYCGLGVYLGPALRSFRSRDKY